MVAVVTAAVWVSVVGGGTSIVARLPLSFSCACAAAHGRPSPSSTAGACAGAMPPTRWNSFSAASLTSSEASESFCGAKTSRRVCSSAVTAAALGAVGAAADAAAAAAAASRGLGHVRCRAIAASARKWPLRVSASAAA